MARLWAEWAEISMQCAWNAPDIEVTEQVIETTGFCRDILPPSSHGLSWRRRRSPVWRIRIRAIVAGAAEGPDTITSARPIPSHPGYAAGASGRAGDPRGDSGPALAARHRGGVRAQRQLGCEAAAAGFGASPVASALEVHARRDPGVMRSTYHGWS